MVICVDIYLYTMATIDVAGKHLFVGPDGILTWTVACTVNSAAQLACIEDEKGSKRRRTGLNIEGGGGGEEEEEKYTVRRTKVRPSNVSRPSISTSTAPHHRNGTGRYTRMSF